MYYNDINFTTIKRKNCTKTVHVTVLYGSLLNSKFSRENLYLVTNNRTVLGTCEVYIGETLSDVPISDRFVELLKFPNTHDLILVFIESIEHTRRFCVIQLELILQKVYGVRFL